MRAWAWALVLFVACSKQSAPTGTERGPCTSDHTCSGGLVCLSDLCVRPPAGDCSQVAEALASVKLGNYASADQRGPLVASLRDQCSREELSVDDAKCITAAKSKFEMSRCAKPLLPELIAMKNDKGGCKTVGARMEEMAKTEMSKDPSDPMSKMMPQLIEAVIASCNEDGWPDDVKGCIATADASNSHAAESCIEKMPSDVRDKFMKRIQTIMEGAMKDGAAQTPTTPPAAMPPPTAPTTP